MTKFAILLAISFALLNEISGHGMMLGPPNRSSLWRFDPTAPVNYNDNQNYCGGMDHQWHQFNGKCGVCGDPYDQAHPQDNENTGKYGTGKVVASYTSGSIIPIWVNLTTNHLGNFKYSVCVLTNPNGPESGEDCFIPITLDDGSPQLNITAGMKYIRHHVKLPDGLTCNRCVLRWTYTAGNNWGPCPDGSYQEGCGPQETFRSCADVTIA